MTPIENMEDSTARDAIPDEDIYGMEFIRTFVENQRLNDYYNVAVDAAESIDPKNSGVFDGQNQEIDPNSR